MSKAEGFTILDSQNAVSIGDIAEKVAKPHTQSVVRRKLADISNLPQKPGPLIQEKPQSIPTTTKEYIDQLRKENMALVKMLAQRNKIIEQSGTELDRLRVNLQKLQEQNKQLALSNTQMLAELNSGKDRSKSLQHELGCTNGLLKALKLEFEDKANTRPCINRDSEFQEKKEPPKEVRDAEKPHTTEKRFLSSCLSLSKQIKENAENKRPCVKRQPARFKSADLKPAEKDELHDDPIPEKGSTSENPLVKDEDNKYNSSLGHESQESKKEKVSTRPHKNSDAELTKSREEGESSKEVGNDEKPRNAKRSFPANNQSKEKTENKRPFVRRQSARLRSGDIKPEEDNELPDIPITEIEESNASTVKIEENERRISDPRPSRVAAKKVQSYKEIPLKVKMRRPE